MRVAVCGGRNEYLPMERTSALIKALESLAATEVVTGGCSGIDEAAEEVAQFLGLATTTFRAAWETLGRKAGPMRNQEIAEYADALIALPGGRGTQDMVCRMQKLKKPVYFLG